MKTGRSLSTFLNLFIVALLAVTVWQARRLRGASEMTPADLPPPFEIGNEFPNVSFITEAGSSVRVAELFGASCGVMHFFASSCQACVGHAPKWSGLDSFTVGAVKVPVAWIATKATDPEAQPFLERYDLPGPLYRIRSDGDQKDLRVFFVPASFMIRGREIISFVGSTPQDTLISGSYAGRLEQVCAAP
ncbi:MAG: TlpA family protein disulfide reductase [Gemmatimonadota bacterium]